MLLPFDDLPAAQEPMAPQLADMHRRWGAAIGKTCGACIHLVSHDRNRTYYKCGLTRQTFGPATDWRRKWPACGAFAPENDA